MGLSQPSWKHSAWGCLSFLLHRRRRGCRRPMSSRDLSPSQARRPAWLESSPGAARAQFGLPTSSIHGLLNMRLSRLLPQPAMVAQTHDCRAVPAKNNYSSWLSSALSGFKHSIVSPMAHSVVSPKLLWTSPKKSQWRKETKIIIIKNKIYIKPIPL